MKEIQEEKEILTDNKGCCVINCHKDGEVYYSTNDIKEGFLFCKEHIDLLENHNKAREKLFVEEQKQADYKEFREAISSMLATGRRPETTAPNLAPPCSPSDSRSANSWAASPVATASMSTLSPRLGIGTPLARMGWERAWATSAET